MNFRHDYDSMFNSMAGDTYNSIMKQYRKIEKEALKELEGLEDEEIYSLSSEIQNVDFNTFIKIFPNLNIKSKLSIRVKAFILSEADNRRLKLFPKDSFEFAYRDYKCISVRCAYPEINEPLSITEFLSNIDSFYPLNYIELPDTNLTNFYQELLLLGSLIQLFYYQSYDNFQDTYIPKTKEEMEATIFIIGDTYGWSVSKTDFLPAAACINGVYYGRLLTDEGFRYFGFNKTKIDYGIPEIEELSTSTSTSDDIEDEIQVETDEEDDPF